MYLRLLKNNIKKGILHLHLPDGTSHRFGDQGLEAHWYVRNEKAINRVARDPEFELGQTYMEQGWDAGEGEDALKNLLAVLRINFPAQPIGKWYSPLVRLYQQYNKIARSYRDIAHHYDTDEPIFRKFLDKEMFYSCAFFNHENDSLEQAQLNKADVIARKLLLKPGMKVLDIGCGWGSLAFYLAQHYGAEVTGITLSNEQLRVALDEAKKRNLDNVHFELADYREHMSQYDRIVSVGMMEHVGVANLDVYFSRVNDMLTEDGVALIHTIGNRSLSSETNPWINRYIFPGGRIPTLSETAGPIEKSGLMLTDLEVWRLHYAWTLKEWQRRFQAHRQEILAIKDEAFCRMWEFYLAGSEMSFEYAELVVFQFQLAEKHGIVPVKRDYLYAVEDRGESTVQYEEASASA